MTIKDAAAYLFDVPEDLITERSVEIIDRLFSELQSKMIHAAKRGHINRYLETKGHVITMIGQLFKNEHIGALIHFEEVSEEEIFSISSDECTSKYFFQTPPYQGWHVRGVHDQATHVVTIQIYKSQLDK